MEKNERDEKTCTRSEGISRVLLAGWRTKAMQLLVESSNFVAKNVPLQRQSPTKSMLQNRYAHMSDEEFKSELKADKEANCERARNGLLPDPVVAYEAMSKSFDDVKRDLRIAFTETKERMRDEEEQV
jgi:hypothetical protein